jgi:hypothetical protein
MEKSKIVICDHVLHIYPLGLSPMHVRCRKHAYLIMKIEVNGEIRIVNRCQKHFFTTIENLNVHVIETKTNEQYWEKMAKKNMKLPKDHQT